jgi:acid stress-induced BolA-like protein IbaG/YrbA
VLISLDELIHRQSLVYAGLAEQQQKLSTTPPWLAASMKQSEDRLDELNSRRERRLADLERECQCAIGDIQHVGAAWVLPHPERSAEALHSMVRDEEIERIAVQAAIAYEKSQGRQAESVEAQNRGFDLISRKPHPEDPATAIDVRFIEVKGRALSGEIALTTNEFKTAERLKQDYWLYAVYNCSTQPELHAIRNPARLGWKPVVKVEHYIVDQSIIRAAEKE